MFLPMKKGGIFKVSYERHESGYHVHVLKRNTSMLDKDEKSSTKAQDKK